MLPGQVRSDDAARLYLKLLIKLAGEVGQQRFNEAVEKAIETCERRPTINMMRKLAGVATIEPSEVAEAWDLVTTIVTRHARYNEGGSVVLIPRSIREGNEVIKQPIPELSPSIRRAVNALGGWAGLVDAHPVYWHQRFMAFKDLYWNDSTK